ncbi:MAG: MFS transporter [Anaerolineae bacterium]|nr:MFS transporter [Anaerolineae bacterium]
MVMATLLGLASVLPVWLVFAVVRERPEFQDLPTPGLVDSFRMAASNKAFLIVAGVYLLTWMPIDLIQFVLVFLIRDYFRLDGGARDLIFLLLFGVGVLALPLWVWISHKLDKPRAINWAWRSWLWCSWRSVSAAARAGQPGLSPGRVGRHRCLGRPCHPAGDSARCD